MLFTESLISLTESPNDLIAIPKRIEKTIICNMLPSAMAFIGLDGIMPNIISLILGLSGIDNEIEVSRSKLLPGLKSTAIVKPIDIAIAVVVKYRPIVLPAIQTKLKFWSKDETPLVKEKKTNGTTMSFNKEIKTWPPMYKKPSIK